MRIQALNVRNHDFSLVGAQTEIIWLAHSKKKKKEKERKRGREKNPNYFNSLVPLIGGLSQFM